MRSACKVAELRAHVGQSMLHHANVYPTILAMILELVQNSLDTDVNASKIHIVIDYKRHQITHFDNGLGVSEEKFNQCLMSIATPGRKEGGSLGRFAIGLISPLGKCFKFVFTSCPNPDLSNFKSWTFITKDIVSRVDKIMIPVSDRTDLTLEKNPRNIKTSVWWRSRTDVIDFTKDKTVNKLTMQGLIEAILSRYSSVMRKNKTIISIEIIDEKNKIEKVDNITAPEYTGKKLEEENIRAPKVGNVKFKLYLSLKNSKGYQGKVVVGETGDKFRFPIRYISSISDGLINEDAFEALSSGFFEGEITGEEINLHPNRQSFVKNDAFLGFCIAINEWFEYVGKKHLEKAKQEKNDQRFQNLGLISMEVIKGLCLESSVLMDVINSFGYGSIGEGHAPKKPFGKMKESSVSVDSLNLIKKVLSDDPNGRVKEVPVSEKEQHHPFQVAGPKGDNRTIVKKSSFGLTFDYKTTAGEDGNSLWELDIRYGILCFNIRHPLWAKCEVRDSSLMKFQEFIAIQALTLYSMPENCRLVQRMVMDEMIANMVPWFLMADSVRISAKKKTVKD